LEYLRGNTTGENIMGSERRKRERERERERERAAD
jgi:hypothetical protein